MFKVQYLSFLQSFLFYSDKHESCFYNIEDNNIKSQFNTLKFYFRGI